MSGFDRRTSENNDTYMMNPQVALPIPYSHGDSQDFGMTESGGYPFSQQTFNSYTPQFNSPYNSGLSPQAQHLSPHHSPVHSIPSTPDHPGLQHQPVQYVPQSRYIQSPRYMPLRDALGSTEIESQDSRNENTMLSEPIIPALDGFPNVREFDRLMKSYVEDLSIKKQDKALIHAKRAHNIRTVLLDPKDTAIESAQFRFWVKKMFKLQTVGSGNSDGRVLLPQSSQSTASTKTSLHGKCTKMICHEGKPVAVREKLFKILTRAHQQCQHGGRDKTSAQVRQIYSWVPKELISRFVKICPTCQVRRGGSRLTPPNSRRGSPRLDMISRSPKLPSPPVSRRESTLNGHMAVERPQADYFDHFGGHSSWIDSQRSVNDRTVSLGLGSVRTLGVNSLGHLPTTIAATMDNFAGDISVASSHVTYGSEYEPATHASSSHREF